MCFSQQNSLDLTNFQDKVNFLYVCLICEMNCFRMSRYIFSEGDKTGDSALSDLLILVPSTLHHHLLVLRGHARRVTIIHHSALFGMSDKFRECWRNYIKHKSVITSLCNRNEKYTIDARACLSTFRVPVRAYCVKLARKIGSVIVAS